MEIGEAPKEVIKEPIGKKRYEVEGTGIQVAWKLFKPKEAADSQEASERKKAVVFLPGWSITEQAKSIEILCHTFANYSRDPVYAVDTRTERIVPDSLTKEAEAVRQFIQEKGLKDLTIIGNSLGGAEAIHLVASLQERNPDINIDGLILLDSLSLYDQTGTKLAVNYTRDMINTRMALRKPPKMQGSDVLAIQNRKYLKDGTAEILKEAMRSHIRFPQRTINEIQAMAKANPHLAEIKSPIVLIQGLHDLLSNPARIIPNQNLETEGNSEYIEDIHEREQFLKEHVFTNSPYVRMIVPEKMGHHNVTYSRPESAAKTSLYLLKRWHRQKA